MNRSRVRSTCNESRRKDASIPTKVAVNSWCVGKNSLLEVEKTFDFEKSGSGATRCGPVILWNAEETFKGQYWAKQVNAVADFREAVIYQ